MGTAKSQQGPRKSNIFKKENEGHRGKKGFLSKGGYFEGNLFFSFPTLCHLLSFLMEIIFFLPAEAFSCAVRALCLPNQEQRGPPWRDSGSEGTVGLALGLQLLAGSLRRPRREAGGGRARQAVNPLPAPPASDLLCTTQSSGPGCRPCSAHGSLPRQPALISSVPAPAPAPELKTAGPGR